MRKLLVLLLFACNFQLSEAAAPKRPKLIVAMMIDQFRYDYLTRFRPEYKEGLLRLLEHGAVFTNAHHIAAPTVTAIGHSTFMSGATPSLSGIAGNEWYDRATKRSVTSVSDDSVNLLGGGVGVKGSSPHNLLVSTVGDEVKMSGFDSKIIGISIKDRSAILPAGHTADAAYWFDSESSRWVTSTYYVPRLPDWVKEINSHNPIQKYLGEQWFPLAAGKGAKPFCTMVAGSDIPFCQNIESTPWGNDLIEEFTEQAITHEQLGHHAFTDILSVSFSANDYVGHAMGPDSPEVHDISVRTDRLLGKFFEFLDNKVGKDEWLLVMSADHGVAPIPEVNEERRMPGGRLTNEPLMKAAQEALVKKYGEGKWIEAQSTASLYLNFGLIEQKKLSRAEVEETAADALRKLAHEFRVFTGQELVTGQGQNDFVTQAFRNGYVPNRSPDVLFLADPFYIFSPSGTTHGTPFNYDTHVPIIFFGTGIKAGTYYDRVAVNDVAPTLSAILGTPLPSGSVGRILSEIFE